MSRSWLSSGDLIGRDAEVRDIHGFVADASVRGGALLLTGEAGIGKSALLDAVAERAATAGALVLRAAGVQYEADVSYSGLHQLLFTLHERLDVLSPVHSAALRAALGLDGGPAPERLLVSNAVLLLGRAVSADAPLLLVVDDLPWIDRSSAAVLGFVARRLAGSRVGLLAAARSGLGSVFDSLGLPERVVPPLDDKASEDLLAGRFPDLAATIRRQLQHQARGNPLALLELPPSLAGSQMRAVHGTALTRPIGERLQEHFTERVASLPADSRQLLLLAALSGVTDLGLLRQPSDDRYEPDDLEPAERAGLVDVGAQPGRFTFRHPLIASAVVEASTSAECRSTHLLLAHLMAADPERRAWHLGEATVLPDENVADQLEDAAHRILRRGNAHGAVATLIRAAELSPEAAGRGRRLAEAAYVGADAAGTLDTASRLLADARREGPTAGGSLHAAAAAVYLLINGDGDVATAHRLLVGAIESPDHDNHADDPALIDALHTLVLICWFVGRPEAWQPLHTAVARLKPAPPDLLFATAAIFSDAARVDRDALDRLDRVLSQINADTDPGTIIRAGTAAVYADRLSDLREANQRLIRLGREGTGPARRYLGALMNLGLDYFHSGRWSEAEELAVEGARVCEEHNYPFFRWYFDYQQALLAAVRGDTTTSGRITDELVRWAATRGVRGAEMFARQPRSLCAIGLRDYESAYQNAVALTPPGVLAAHVPHALWLGMDLVEAAVHTNRHAEAAAHVAALRQANGAGLSRRLELLTAGAAAMVADGDQSRELFEVAIGLPEADRWPFDLARIRLAYGERLRRCRATGEARQQLVLALESFDRLGATAWSERAAKELRATGQTRTRAASGIRSNVLTAQEREVAQLAGAGLTNKQIGERLFLSHRTVGDHLYRIFPKLGVTSRAAIRDALTAYDRLHRDDETFDRTTA